MTLGSCRPISRSKVVYSLKPSAGHSLTDQLVFRRTCRLFWSDLRRIPKRSSSGELLFVDCRLRPPQEIWKIFAERFPPSRDLPSWLWYSSETSTAHGTPVGLGCPDRMFIWTLEYIAGRDDVGLVKASSLCG